MFALSSSVYLQSGSRLCGDVGGAFKEELRLLPFLTMVPLGAGKRGPGTNVAIMVMVRITGPSHYRLHLGLPGAADCPAVAAASIVERQHFGHQGWLR